LREVNGCISQRCRAQSVKAETDELVEAPAAEGELLGGPVIGGNPTVLESKPDRLARRLTPSYSCAATADDGPHRPSPLVGIGVSTGETLAQPGPKRPGNHGSHNCPNGEAK